MKHRQSFARAPNAPRLARRFVRTTLAELDPEVVAVIELMVAELATNSVQHARTDFEVSIDVTANRVCVEIVDSGDGQPTLRRPPNDQPTGRGLLIVDTLADEWSVVPHAHGKLVRFCKELGPRGGGAALSSAMPAGY